MNAEEVVNLLDLEDSDILASYRSECFDLLQCTDENSVLGVLPSQESLWKAWLCKRSQLDHYLYLR